MIREFEGKTEQEAIAKAMAELGLDENEFDVEVMEEAKKGLFTKGKVKIRIHVEEEGEPIEADYEADPELERKLCVFVETVVQKMGFAGRVSVSGREGSKLFLDLTSADANLLMASMGRTWTRSRSW